MHTALAFKCYYKNFSDLFILQDTSLTSLSQQLDFRNASSTVDQRAIKQYLFLLGYSKLGRTGSVLQTLEQSCFTCLVGRYTGSYSLGKAIA